jgi:hypothetical protein
MREEKRNLRTTIILSLSATVVLLELVTEVLVSSLNTMQTICLQARLKKVLKT